MARRNERPLSGSPSRDTQDNRQEQLDPQAQPQSTSQTVVSPEAAKAERLKSLASGLGSLTQGAEAFFRLQAFYGEQNLKENQLRGLMGLEKSEGKGLGWGVDKGFSQGAGEAAGLTLANEYLAELEKESFGITSDDAVVDPTISERKRNEILDRVTKKTLGSNPQNTDFLSGAQKHILEAKLSGEALAKSELIKRRKELYYTKATEISSGYIQKYGDRMVKLAASSAKQIRTGLKGLHDQFRSNFGMSSEEANEAIIDAFGNEALRLLDEGGANAEEKAENILKVLKTSDSSGYNYMKFRPSAERIRQYSQAIISIDSRNRDKKERDYKIAEEELMGTVILQALNTGKPLSEDVIRSIPMQDGFTPRDSTVARLLELQSDKVRSGGFNYDPEEYQRLNNLVLSGASFIEEAEKARQAGKINKQDYEHFFSIKMSKDDKARSESLQEYGINRSSQFSLLQGIIQEEFATYVDSQGVMAQENPQVVNRVLGKFTSWFYNDKRINGDKSQIDPKSVREEIQRLLESDYKMTKMEIGGVTKQQLKFNVKSHAAKNSTRLQNGE